MSEVTQLFSSMERGDAKAAEELLPLVYQQLRRLAARHLAQEPAGQTLQATALVHEAYIRLVNGRDGQHWDNSSHFFAAAAEAMRRVLVNRARDKRRVRRGSGRHRLDLNLAQIATETPHDELLALDGALEELTTAHPVSAELVKLRFFGGLGLAEAASVLQISERTADRYWACARAWLYDRLRPDSDSAAF